MTLYGAIKIAGVAAELYRDHKINKLLEQDGFDKESRDAFWLSLEYVKQGERGKRKLLRRIAKEYPGFSEHNIIGAMALTLRDAFSNEEVAKMVIHNKRRREKLLTALFGEPVSQ